ncbi:hypothetical protein, partial [Streptomyces bauhiniae]
MSVLPHQSYAPTALPDHPGRKPGQQERGARPGKRFRNTTEQDNVPAEAADHLDTSGKTGTIDATTPGRRRTARHESHTGVTAGVTSDEREVNEALKSA